MSNSFVTPWTVALQVPLSVGFSRQEYWSGSPCPHPGGLPHPGIELVSLTSPALQVDSVGGVLVMESSAGAHCRQGLGGSPNPTPHGCWLHFSLELSLNAEIIAREAGIHALQKLRSHPAYS